MTERKVLIVRVKGGMQIAQGVTNHIIEGLVRGVLVLPEEVTSYAVEEFPALGVENEDTIYTVVPEGVPAIKILNKDDILPIGAFVQVQEESEQRDGEEAPPDPAPQPAEPATPFKPKGAMAEIKREVFIRLQAYQQRTKLGWAQRVSDATGGKVAPDVVLFQYGWQASKGARLEYDYARYIGKNIIATDSSARNISKEILCAVASMERWMLEKENAHG